MGKISYLIEKYVFGFKNINKMAPLLFMANVAAHAHRIVIFAVQSYIPELVTITVLFALSLASYILLERLVKNTFYLALFVPLAFMLYKAIFAVIFSDSVFFIFAICATIASLSYLNPRGMGYYLIFSYVTYCVLMFVFDISLLTQQNVEIGYDDYHLFFSLFLNMVLYAFSHSFSKLLSQHKESERTAIEGSKVKSEFLSRMSHEIRTPLNAIINLNRSVLRKSDLQDDVKSKLKIIDTSSNYLLYLVNDILDFSKIEEGEVEIIESEYFFKDLIRDAANIIRENFKDSSINFDVNMNPSLMKTKLYGDRVKVNQVILNILTNAFKYTQSKGSEGFVQFSTDIKEWNGDEVHVEFRIKDNGIGMSEQNLKELYVAFKRFNLEINSSIEGVGLGLAITHRVLEVMGGTIDITSKENVGTEVVMALWQRSIKEENPEKTEHERQAEEKSSIVVLENISALVVDDIESNLVVAEDLLSEFGVTVETCQSGLEALKMLSEGRRFDIIFLDYFMPHMNGLEALERMKKLFAEKNIKIPVIALTANTIVGVRENLLNEGFDGFLAKPIDYMEMQKILYEFR